MPTLAIIGAGSLRHSPAVIASLANYYGERELLVRLYDPIPERLQLFEMLAHHCLVDGVQLHRVEAVEYVEAALQDADWLVVQLDRDSATRYLERTATPEEALVSMLEGLAPETQVLSLLGETRLPLACYQALDWPPEQDEDYRRSMPHQVLRWIRKEEGIGAFLDQFERSPLKRWLEDPSSIPMVVRSAGD